MGKSSGAAVGIDIGSSLIKIVEARLGRDGVQVTAIGIGPTPAGTIDNEMIVDPQALGQAIKHLLAESGISCKRCVSSVAGQSSVVVRIIEVPKMTNQELAETMKWEVERHVPFAADEIMMDFLPIEHAEASPDDQNMEVLLAVAQQEVINTHIETLFAAGLEPFAIDVEPLAICRSLIDIVGESSGEEAIAIISIGAAVTELGVYRNGLLAFPRTLPLAGNSLTNAVSEKLGIPEEEAERLKREQGIVLMDRAGIGGSSMDLSFAPPAALPAEGDLTTVTEDGDDLESMSFIPGLGFVPPQASPPPSAQSDPDFDIDLAPQAPKRVLDFDLAPEEESVPEPPKEAEAVSEPQEPVENSGANAEPEAFDLASLSSLSHEESGRTDFSQEEIFDAMLPAISDIITEIRQSIEYYSSRFQHQPDKIYLCGGTAKLKDLDKLIEADLGIPVILANPLHNLTVLSRNLSEDYLDEVAPMLGVSVGLAIRDMIGE